MLRRDSISPLFYLSAGQADDGKRGEKPVACMGPQGSSHIPSRQHSVLHIQKYT
jgi:hypothetical protein